MRDRVKSDVESALRVLAGSDGLSDEGAVQAMCAIGLPSVLAEKLVVLVPLAFGSVLLAHMGITNLPTTFRIRSPEGDWVSLPLADESYFAHARSVGVEMMYSGPRAVFEPVALRSPQVDAVNKALNDGLTIEEVKQGSFGEPQFLRLDLEAWAADLPDERPRWFKRWSGRSRPNDGRVSSFAHAAAALHETLAADGEWVTDSERSLRGPGTLGIVLDDFHGGVTGIAHVDVGLQLDRDHVDAPIMWDCMVIPNRESEAWARQAANLWRATTFAAVQAFLVAAGDGGYAEADHFAADDPQGLTGWDVIHSPFVSWGRSSTDPLLEWWKEDPVLPTLASTVLPQFTHPFFNTVKVLCGGGASDEITEVRVNGSVADAASAVLAGMAWPRLDATWVRAYVIAVRSADQT